ncbi:uncharacterized protein PV07_04378 [Cladophialophora immunda]|uniref:Uncharacterized protein n=1 Tax=Cladophialophora immunda TaxID=569365 RepID=A0A0D2DAY1_9EURO|nr:uncharacterized protein PV07_04378 [Cladophialophora immunda]KIW32864.1 hypothetical protein PV07_04378 [Cladophialophora immunda]
MKDELVVRAAKNVDLVQPVKVAGFVKANKRRIQVSERKRLRDRQACPGFARAATEGPFVAGSKERESSFTAVAQPCS